MSKLNTFQEIRTKNHHREDFNIKVPKGNKTVHMLAFPKSSDKNFLLMLKKYHSSDYHLFNAPSEIVRMCSCLPSGALVYLQVNACSLTRLCSVSAHTERELCASGRPALHGHCCLLLNSKPEVSVAGTLARWLFLQFTQTLKLTVHDAGKQVGVAERGGWPLPRPFPAVHSRAISTWTACARLQSTSGSESSTTSPQRQRL